MKTYLAITFSLLYIFTAESWAVEPSDNEPNLTISLAQKALNQQINYNMENTLNTCNACCGKNDKEENDSAPVVTNYT